MKIIQLLTLNALVFSTASHAWTWRWTDDDGESMEHYGTEGLRCAKMIMPKGNLYSWEHDGSDYCVHTYSDDNCEYSNGWSCNDWGPRKLGQPWVRSYKVNTIDGKGNEFSRPKTTTTSEPEPTETDEASGTGSETTVTDTSTDSSTSTGDTETSAPTATESSAPSTGGSSLSGGAIAGVVIGTCAGVGIMGLFGLLAYRRGRASSARIQSGSYHGDPRAGELGPPPSPPPPPPAPKKHYPELDSTPATLNPHLNPSTAFTPISPEAQPSAYSAEKGAPSTVPYMANNKRMVELADTSQIPEMDASRGKEW